MFNKNKTLFNRKKNKVFFNFILYVSFLILLIHVLFYGYKQYNIMMFNSRLKCFNHLCVEYENQIECINFKTKTLFLIEERNGNIIYKKMVNKCSVY